MEATIKIEGLENCYSGISKDNSQLLMRWVESSETTSKEVDVE